MLRQEDFGPVRFYEYTRAFAGRRLMRVGAYRVGELLVDSGPARASGLVDRILGDGPVRDLVLTHHHEDHAGNAAALSRRSNCRVHVHAAGKALVEAPAAIPLYRRLFWGAAAGTSVEILGETVESDRYCFRVIHTPGHAIDHVALHEPQQEWLFVGDLYLTDRPRTAFLYDDVGTIIDSLRTLLALPDCVMFCQHSGYHAGHQHRLGRKLDALLGLQQRALVHRDEGKDLPEIVRALGLRDGLSRWVTQGELSARHLVAGLLRHADATS